MPAKRNILGQRFTRLLVVSESKVRAKNGKVRWDCLCDCGTVTTVDVTSLTCGLTMSCGCLSREITKERLTTHGGTSDALYKTWRSIKQRCYNKNDKSYPRYGGQGIEMDDEFRYNYSAFKEHMGLPPDDGLDYSVDRIDGTKGYVKGNMRWATAAQQSRNRRMPSSNTSGYTGIYYHAGYKDNEYWCVDIRELDGSRTSECFNILQYGEHALQMAIEYRRSEIERLNELGAGYTENHGLTAN